MEMPGFAKYNNMWIGFTQIYKVEGLRGMWQGILPTLLRDTPYTAIWYSSYGQFNILINNISGKK